MADTSHPIERAEERLVVHRSPSLVGNVRIDREVSEAPATLDVDVSRHEVTVDRRRVDRPLADSEETVMTRDGTTVLLVTEERLEVRKVPWVVEEIQVTRREVTEPQRISGTVRRQTIDISTDGDVDLTPPEAKRNDR